MSAVDVAADYARRLIERELHGPGDLDEAMRRVGRQTGVGYWTLWGLWHKRRKLVDTDLFRRLRSAYLDACERQLRALQHELAIEQARGGDDDLADMVGEVQALAAKLEASRTRSG